MRGSTLLRIEIGRTVRVSRPSMRGSPERIWLRTILDFELEEQIADVVLLGRRRVSRQARRFDFGADFLEPLLPCLLLPQCVRFAQLGFGRSGDAGDQCFVLGRRPASPTAACRLPRPAEWIRSMTACCCWWPKTTAPSMTSSGSSLASDSTISTAASVPATTRSSFDVVVSSVLLGIQDVLAVDIADARRADRSAERNARQRDRRRRADHRRNVRIDLGIDRHHRRDDLHFVVEAVREQRPDRTIDQPAGQRFLFRRAAFALEKAAGDAAGGVGFFLVVDGQREEVLAGLRGFGGDDGDEHHAVAEARQHRAARLAGDLAGFKRQRVAAVGYRFLDDGHVCPWVQKATMATQLPTELPAGRHRSGHRGATIIRLFRRRAASGIHGGVTRLPRALQRRLFAQSQLVDQTRDSYQRCAS